MPPKPKKSDSGREAKAGEEMQEKLKVIGLYSNTTIVHGFPVLAGNLSEATIMLCIN